MLISIFFAKQGNPSLIIYTSIFFSYIPIFFLHILFFIYSLVLAWTQLESKLTWFYGWYALWWKTIEALGLESNRYYRGIGAGWAGWTIAHSVFCLAVFDN